MAKKKKDTGYRVALSGARGIVRLLLYVCGIVAIVYLGKSAYGFGYDVLNQKPIASSEASGQDVTVIIKEGTSVYEIGRLLQEKGLIDESPLVFWVQERLSDLHGKINPGSYILRTSQTVDEMLEILTGENTEGQPKPEEKSSSDDEGGGPPHEEEGTKEGGE